MSRSLIIILAVVVVVAAGAGAAAFLFLGLGGEPPVGRELALHIYGGDTYVLVEYDEDLAIFTNSGSPVTSRDLAERILHSYAWKQVMDDLDYSGIAGTVQNVHKVDSSISGVRSASNNAADIFDELDSIGANVPFRGRISAMEVVESAYPGLGLAEGAIRSLNSELNSWGANTDTLVGSATSVVELKTSGDYEGDELVRLFTDAASAAGGAASAVNAVKSRASEAQSSAARLESALRGASDTPVIGGAIGGLASTAARFEAELGDLTQLLGDFESDLSQVGKQFQDGLASASSAREAYMSRWLENPHDPQWPPTDPARRPTEVLETPSGTAPLVSIDLDAAQSGELVHGSGARIEIPAGATAEEVTVSIAEVAPPVSPVEVGRAFNFSIGDAVLLAPVTLHIPFDLEPGMDANKVSALHWDEELRVWIELDRVVDEANGTVAVTVDDLSIFATLFSFFDTSTPLEERLIVPEIVKTRLTPEIPVPERTIVMNRTTSIDYVVRNAGEDGMAGEVDGVGYVELYVENVLVQRSKEIKAIVPRDSNHWKPGHTLFSEGQYSLLDPLKFTASRLGPASLRVELVFESGSGVEIGRDVAAIEVMVTDHPAIAPATVIVDGRQYTVSGEPDSSGRVEYVVEGATGETRDKAIYTAYTQQVIHGSEALFLTKWSPVLTFGASIRYLEAKYGDDVAFALDLIIPIGMAWMFPDPYAISSAAVTVSTGVAEKLIKEFTDNHEEMVEDIALGFMHHSNELVRQSFDLQKRIQNGEALSFEEALSFWNSAAYWKAYWSPAQKAASMLNEGAMSTVISDHELRETANRALAVLGISEISPRVQAAISISRLLSVFHELTVPLAEYAPWAAMITETQANLDRERDRYSELLALLDLSHDYFQLPALAEIPIPHYSTLTGEGLTGESPQDRAALVALYNATGGRNWRNNDNWLSDAPIGEWHGVTINESGRVVELNLVNNHLNGPIPHELGNLFNLTALDLSRNKISHEVTDEEEPPFYGALGLNGEIPPALGNLSTLRKLDLSGNQLTGEIPAELGNLSNLRELDLSRNETAVTTTSGRVPQWYDVHGLNGEIPPALGNLSNLRKLDLSSNQLTGEIPAELGNLSNLRELNLVRNDLWSELPAELGNLAQLEFLDLSGHPASFEIGGNTLTGEIPAELGKLTNLKRLYLHGNRLTGSIPSSLQNLTHLTYLSLDQNGLSGAIPSWLGDLSALTNLYLRENQFTGMIPPELGHLSNLTELTLAYNQLSGCIPAGLRDVPSNDLGKLGLPYCDETSPFKLEYEASASEVAAGDSFTLSIRMYDLQQAGEHGGISVSFPTLTESGGSEEVHSSSVADLEASDYTTGLSNVTFHQPGSTIYRDEREPTPFPAQHLLVESDDSSWARSDDRTLRLRITPKRGGEFPMRIRGWVCADEYTDCLRNPAAGPVKDQQGWVVEELSAEVVMDESTVPGGRFLSVSAGDDHTCGVRRDGSVACWGSDYLDRATPPSGEFASISAGDYHGCGVRRDGSVACWGNDGYGQATPPSGEFASVSAGDDHSWLLEVAYFLTRDMPGDDARFNVNISAGSSLAFSLNIWAMVIV